MSDQESQPILENILNNISCRIEYNNQNYYMLIKKQQGDHSLFFITDFYQNFWIKKINYEFLNDLKTELKIKTQIKSFVEHFANGVKQSCTIKKIKPYPILAIRLKIGDGLVISCSLHFQYNINITEKTSHFSKILEVFGRQLFQVKQIQHKQSLIVIQDLKRVNQEMAPKIINKQRQNQLANSLFNKPQIKIIPQKHRDLINPFRKKRRGKGMKIRKQSSEDQNDS